MDDRKWLKRLLFETTLFNYVRKSENEGLCVNQHLKHDVAIDEISHEWEITPQYVRANIEHGLENTVQTIEQIISKNRFLTNVMLENKMLKEELEALRRRFQKELEDEQVQKEWERLDLPISQIEFSSRTRNVLADLGIKTLNDLQSLTIEKIEVCRNAGQRTVSEIEGTAREFGIEISSAKKGKRGT
jgi:regulator of replication initiation timing